MASGSDLHIPVIDVHDFPAQSEKLIVACKEWGCFRIINHGVPVTLMSEMKAVAVSLFDRPPEIKRRNANAIVDRGYIVNQRHPLYEGMGVYDPASPGAVEAFCTQLDASPHQRETILRYSQSIHELALHLGCKLVESMGLVGDLFKGWPCQFRLNKYNFSPETVGLTGGQLHSDVGFLTILQVDEIVSGLEVMDKKTSTFIPVDPLPGTLFVNLGDLAKAWSNGRFHSVKHRVQCNKGRTRLSIALFVLGPKDEQVLEAPPELVDPEHPRLYVPISFEHYRSLRTSTRLIAGQALELLHTTTTNTTTTTTTTT